jgi:small-conductance mechanosensitive channel
MDTYRQLSLAQWARRCGRVGALWAIVAVSQAQVTPPQTHTKVEQGGPQTHATTPQTHATPPAGRAAQSDASVPGTAPGPPSATGAAAPSVLPLTSDQVAAHLGETVDWFHHLAAVEQLQMSGVDSGSRDKLRQQSLTAVELAFDFGKACAALLDAQSRQSGTPATPAAGTTTPAKGFAGRLDQAAADVDQRVATLQSKLDALKEQIAHAPAKERETLTAQEGQVTAALHLARDVQATVQDMEDFETSSIAGDNGNLSPLDGQIADMERSVPELRETSGRGAPGGNSTAGSASTTSGGSAAAGAAGTASGGASSGSAGHASGGPSPAGNSPNASSTQPGTSTTAFRADSAGVIALVGEWLSLHNTQRQLGDFIKETGDLQDEIEKVRASLTSDVRTIVANDLAISTSTDPAQLLAQRQALEADAARFKQLSTVLVPIGEQALIVESVLGTLSDWGDTLGARMASVARYLALRIGIVLGWIAVVLIISEVWRRATFRYLHDLRRRRQFMVLRRVAVGAALTVVIAFGLVSEIGSIATYIGFVTAGIAVALQNVILAVVAYFFLIGRYGVRVGDRITLSGVTGRVVDIGLVRIYLMELAGPDLHPTGRMVVLSNAVLFQPTALFKQIPGADYVWHTVTLTIAATADVVEAHKRLKAAAEEVYEKYRPAIERQHAVVQRFIDFDATSPQPEIRVRLTENGLECAVRYPVELENAAVIDQQMLKALRDALEKDSQFKLVSSGAVVLKSSDT